MKYVLAPLAGFTDAPFRILCGEGGADLCYTEMVSAPGLARGSLPTRRLAETMPGEGPVAVQLFGASESDMAAAAEFVDKLSRREEGARIVELNLNAGCPMTKVTREGAGSKLMEQPAQIFRLLRAMKENCALPITLKTRIGPRPGAMNVFEILDAAEKAGVAGISVHARYTSQMHGGEVHLDVLKEVVRRATVPITGNGSVTDAKSATAMSKTGVSAIMIGRAALTDPCIFSKLKGNSPSDSVERFPSALQRHLYLMLQYRRLLSERYPNDRLPSMDAYASVKMHTHLFRYFNGRPGAAKLRQRLNSVRTLSEINDIISSSMV